MAASNTNLPYPVAVGDDDTENAQTTFAGSTSALTIPAGTNGQRPLVPIDGQIRFNIDTNQHEVFVGGQWMILERATRVSVTAANTNLGAADSGLIINNKGAVVKTNINAPSAGLAPFQIKLENMTSLGARFTGIQIPLPKNLSPNKNPTIKTTGFTVCYKQKTENYGS